MKGRGRCERKLIDNEIECQVQAGFTHCRMDTEVFPSMSSSQICLLILA